MKSFLTQLDKNNSAGQDGNVPEMLEASDNFGTDIIDGLYNNGDIPGELSRSVFTELPEKQGSNECELSLIISAINHKFIIRILINRSHSRISPEIKKM